jgi:imidazole glycerol-phosphate synthase subunit HisH
MIIIIDYGMGNVGSIRNMLKALGSESSVSADLDVIRSAKKLILPGVGAFDAGMNQLQQHDLRETLNEAVLERRVPILGICLGMQLMTRRSDEGVMPGLGWVDAEVVRFDRAVDPRLKIPHMGWNTVQPSKDSALLSGLTGEQRFYFVHSYRVRCAVRSDVLLTSEYGIQFDAAFEVDNIMGVQFHPEKSHRFGMSLLRNFVERY